MDEALDTDIHVSIESVVTCQTDNTVSLTCDEASYYCHTCNQRCHIKLTILEETWKRLLLLSYM